MRTEVLTSVSKAIYSTMIIVLTAGNCSPLDSGLSLPGNNTGQAPSSHVREVEYHWILSVRVV